MKRRVPVGKLRENELKAVEEFKNEVLRQFSGARIVLYGSKARGLGDEFSDIDLLVLLDQLVDTTLEEGIFEIAFKIGLKFDVVLSVLVESKDFWNSPLAKVMPFSKNVEREGIVL